LQKRACPVQSNFDRSFGNPQNPGGFAHIHFFDVSEKYYVTVNLGKFGNSLAQKLAQLLAFQRFRGHFAPAGEDGGSVVSGLLVDLGIERILAAMGGFATSSQNVGAGDRQETVFPYFFV